MNDELVEIESFASPIEANLARSKLESSGIEASLGNEEIVAMDWRLAQAVGGVQLLVRQSDAEEAKRIINEILQRRASESQEPESIDAQAERAYRAAAFGLIFFPLQAYSLYLLFLLRSQLPEDVPVTVNRRIRLTLLMNCGLGIYVVLIAQVILHLRA